MSQAGITSLSAATPLNFTTSAGVAVPVANNINIIGANGITTSAAGNTVTISAASPQTYTTNSGVATVSGNNINISGTNGITTSGAGSTVSISGANFGQTITGSTGGNLSPNFGNWNFIGSGGITTSGSGNTLTITGSPSFAPNAIVNEFDDFLSFTANNEFKLSWYNFGNHFTMSSPGVAGHDGIITGIANTCAIHLADSSTDTQYPFVLGSGSLSVNWVINIQGLSVLGNRYELFIGIGDTANPIGDQVNGCYFTYSDNLNSGNWSLVTASASTRTTQATSTVVGTGWINLGVSINATATSVTYFINGVQVGTPITTNIPTTPIGSIFGSLGVSGVPAIPQADLMYYTRTFTTPR